MMFKKYKLIKVWCFFIPIFQIYNLQRGKEDLKNRLKSAAEIRKSIDDAFNVFLATKKSVQEMCSEEVKESIDNDLNAILQRIVVNDHIDDKAQLLVLYACILQCMPLDVILVDCVIRFFLVSVECPIR